MRRSTQLALVALAALSLASCLFARPDVRSYYVLHPEGLPAAAPRPPIRGLVHVRNLDADAVYEKFQMVVRQSPYQLRYSDLNVWAVKPSDMASDLLSQALAATNSFAAVTRVLFESRPDYTLSGELEALEIYDSEELWFAHLALTVYLSRFEDGKRVWGMHFDERKEVTTRTFAHGVRVLSELLGLAAGQMIAELGELDVARSDSIPTPEEMPAPTLGPQPAPLKEKEPIYVPEPSGAKEGPSEAMPTELTPDEP